MDTLIVWGWFSLFLSFRAARALFSKTASRHSQMFHCFPLGGNSCFRGMLFYNTLLLQELSPLLQSNTSPSISKSHHLQFLFLTCLNASCAAPWAGCPSGLLWDVLATCPPSRLCCHHTQLHRPSLPFRWLSSAGGFEAASLRCCWPQPSAVN